MQRVRNLDERSFSSCAGYTKDPNISRYYVLSVIPVLGRKKVTIDNPRPFRDYRYDMIPTQKTKVYRGISYLPSTYKGKKQAFSGKRVKPHRTVTYTKYISLRRPKTPGLKIGDGKIKMNDFQVAQVLGYCSRGVLITPKLPAGWTTYWLEGTFASECVKDTSVQTFLGIDLNDLTRPLTLDTAYAQTALTRAMAEVSAPDVDFAEIVGELDQLTKLIEDPFKTLGGLLRKFQRYSSMDAWICKPRHLPRLSRKAGLRLAYNQLDLPTLLAGGSSLLTFRTRRKVGRRKVAKSVITEATQRWLQYRYGITPLMCDITEVLEKFQEKIKPLVKVYQAKRTVVATRTTSVWEVTRASIIPGFTFTYRVTGSVFDRTTAKVYYKMTLFDKYVDLRDLGLDSSNIIPAMHNLGPWSFVVDWFYGIGDWLRCWNMDPALRTIGNSVSRKKDTNLRIEIVKVTYFGYLCQVPSSRYYSHRQELCRKVNQPEPALPVFNPDFLKWRRVLDTFSLLWGRMPALRR